jgi:outer membrane protein OmpA-like peptidoglycan-associated protein
MEARFGHDFSGVRVHTDGQAAASAAAYGAIAYTVGRDVVMGAGAFAPETASGRRVLAHELAHVVQSGGAASTATGIGSPHDPAEREADAAAAAVGRPGLGPTAGAGLTMQHAGTLRRQPAPPQKTAPAGAATQPATAQPDPVLALDSFATNSSTLTQQHRVAIDAFAGTILARLGASPGASLSSLRVVGHTDTTGSDKHNTGLGATRAESVKAALAAALTLRKVSLAAAGEIAVETAGERELAVETGDNVAEPRNRRVVITATIAGATAAPVQPAGPGSAASGEGSRPQPAIRPERSPTSSPVPAETARRVLTLADLVAQAGDAATRDPLIRSLRDLLSEIQPLMSKEDAQKAIDDAIRSVIKDGVNDAIKALLEGLAGQSAQTMPAEPSQVGPVIPEMDRGEQILKGPKIPINDAPAVRPRTTFDYRNGPRSSYPPGAQITFTLLPPANFADLKGGKRLVIVSDAERDATNANRLARVTLESGAPRTVTLTAPTTPGKYVFRVDVGLGYDYSSMREFEVKAPTK